MLVSDLLTLIRYRINDTTSVTTDREFADTELLEYLNNAYTYLSHFLIGRKDPEMITSASVADTGSVPSNFHSFVGEVPAWIDGGVFHTYGSTVTLRYYATKALATATTDTVPFMDSRASVLAQLASIYALNRLEYNVDMDKALMEACLALYGGGAS